MAIRTKQGRPRIVSAPQRATEGRRAALATATPARQPHTIEARQVRLGLAILEREKARQQEQRKPSASTTAARRKAEKATSYRLHELKDAGGPEVARDTIEAFTGASFRLLMRVLANADLEQQHYALQAMLHAGDIAREHNVTASAATAMLARASIWDALSQRLMHGALTSTALDADTLKVAALAGRESRLDTLGALALARQTTEPTTPTIDVQARVREYEQKRLGETSHSAEDDAGHLEATEAGDDALEALEGAEDDRDGGQRTSLSGEPGDSAAPAGDATAKRFAATAGKAERQHDGAADRKRPVVLAGGLRADDPGLLDGPTWNVPVVTR